MQELFTPNLGLMVWTVVTFLILVALLARFGWGPMIAAIETREEGMRAEREAAEKARAQAERIQADLEAKLAAIDEKSREVLARAGREAEALRARHAVEAQREAKRLLEKTRAELEEEKRRLIVELRADVATLAVTAAEKLLRRSVDEQVRKNTLDQFFRQVGESATVTAKARAGP